MADTKIAVKEIALCHVIRNGSLLLIRTEEGLSKGKWNAPNGEILKGEQPYKSAMKQVFQQTGLYVNKVVDNGTVRLFLNGSNEFTYKLHIFSTKLFSGDLKPNIKGEPRWFNISEIPYYEMWADDKYWTNLVLQGKKFDADFFFDEKNEKIVKYQIRERQEIVKRALPILAIIAIAAILIFGITSSGILNGKTNTTKSPVAFIPSTTVSSTTTITSTVPTTTIASPVPPVPSATTVVGGTPNNQTYIYYITTTGTPPVTRVYYSIASGAGVSGWTLIAGNPVDIKNAQCNVYPGYMYCTGTANTTAIVYTTAPSSPTTTTPTAKSNQTKVYNPACGNPSDQYCYNLI